MIDFAPVQTRRTFEEAVDQIAERIALGDLRLGDQLPSERTLAAKMQISRPTLREAIKVLADAGVVEVRAGAGGGAFVRSEFVPKDVLRRFSDLRVSDLPGVLEARRLLEPGVAVLAAARAGDSDFALLQRTIDLQRALGPTPAEFLHNEDRFLALDQQFHVAIARATGNTTVVSLVRTLMRRLEIARDMAMHEPPVFDWAIDIHDRTLDAIRRRDSDLVEEVMDEHLGRIETVVKPIDQTGTFG